MGSFRHLRINNNLLTTLPEEIGDLESLRSLVLFENKLSSLPNSIENLAKRDCNINLDLGKIDKKTKKLVDILKSNYNKICICMKK